MEPNYKEVNYAHYCRKCKHWECKQEDEPCDSCLAEPTNLGSRKPVKFEKRK